MKTKEEIIQAFKKYPYIQIEDINDAVYYLSQPTLNPMKIDEERMINAHDIILRKSTYSQNQADDYLKDLIQEYNSTLEDHQVLQPLPSEMPEEFDKFITYLDEECEYKDIWKWLVYYYGTPTKKELVSVEELTVIIKAIWRGVEKGGDIAKSIAQHLVDTYSLHPPKREWWMDLKEGDKFMCNITHNKIQTFHHVETTARLFVNKNVCYTLDHCTPYIEPSIHDKFMASLSDEQKKMYEEMKEVKNEL